MEQVIGIEIYDTGASANATGKGGKLTTLFPTSRSAAGVGGIAVAKETTNIDVLLVPVSDKSDDEQVGYICAKTITLRVLPRKIGSRASIEVKSKVHEVLKTIDGDIVNRAQADFIRRSELTAREEALRPGADAHRRGTWLSWLRPSAKAYVLPYAKHDDERGLPEDCDKAH